MSNASTSVDGLDRSDVTVGTKVVPRRSRVRSGGPICLSERRTANRGEAALAGEEGRLDPDPTPLRNGPRRARPLPRLHLPISRSHGR
jgi:hypothetical protein